MRHSPLARPLLYELLGAHGAGINTASVLLVELYPAMSSRRYTVNLVSAGELVEQNIHNPTKFEFPSHEEAQLQVSCKK